MRSSVRPLAALASGLVALAVFVTAAPAATASTTARAAATPHFAGGYLPSNKVVTAESQLRKAGSRAAETLPDSVDLRANAPAVGYQGQVSSCVAWTIGYSIMGYYAKVNGGTGAPYAPLYLYLRALNGLPVTRGLIPEEGLTVATKAGVDTQSDYFQGTTDFAIKPTDAEIANAKNYRLTGYTPLWSGKVNQGTAGQLLIERALAAGTPVAIGLPVFQDFYAIKDSTVYNTLSGASQGGHMVAVYGYDSKGIWIRNSWGTGWGVKGDAELSWAFVNKLVNSAFSLSGLTAASSPTVPAPTVAALSTKSGATAGGGTATITGTGLASATGVKFGDKTATFTATTTTTGVTQLVATIPARAAGTVDVTVTNASGASPAVAASKFAYVAPVPAVTKVAPATSVIFGGQPVTLTGTGLTDTKTVKVGNTVATSFTVVSDTSLTFVAPKSAAASAIHITVTTPGGTSKSGTTDVFTYLNPPAPTVTSLSVTSGKTTAAVTVTATGTNFTGATVVLVGGVRTTFTPISETRLSVVVPKHAAGTGSVQVTTPGGTSPASSTNEFRWVTS